MSRPYQGVRSLISLNSRSNRAPLNPRRARILASRRLPLVRPPIRHRSLLTISTQSKKLLRVRNKKALTLASQPPVPVSVSSIFLSETPKFSL